MNKYNVLGFILYSIGILILGSGVNNNTILQFVWGGIFFIFGIILILKDDKPLSERNQSVKKVVK